MHYLVIIEKTANGYIAYLPDLPGCVAAGNTLCGTKQLIREAVELHFEDMRQRGELIPPPDAESVFVELPAA